METFSDGQISDPTRAQYRTVPLRPHNVTFAPQSIGPTSFSVRWSGPIGISEFDRYQVRTGGHSVRVVARTGMMRILFQVAIGIRRKTPQIIERGQPLVARFTENLTPGGWSVVWRTTRALSWLKVPTSAFKLKTLLRHCAKRLLTHRK